MKIPQKFHTRKMLASDWSTYFVYPQNNRGNPFLVASCPLIGRRHDNKHYVTQVQVRRFPKYCTLVIKSLSKIMLRNGFKNFDDHRITSTKPNQSLIGVLISK